MKSKNKMIRNLIILAVIVLVIIMLIMFLVYQNKHIDITKFVYFTDKIGNDLDGFTIVQISDLHNEYFGKENKTIIKKIKNLSPDILVITGDLNYGDESNIDSGLKIISEMSKIIPVYYVTGNHEYYVDPESRKKIFELVESAGAIYLDNEMVNITKENDSFCLVGLDDNHLTDGTLSNLLNGRDEFNVVLAHEPQNIRQYALSGANLVLSGHAHGGQIRIPFIGAIVAPDQPLFPRYTSGIHTVNNTDMIVSRGLGTSHIPLRLFNCPEIVCVRLQKKDPRIFCEGLFLNKHYIN